jgi:hypothetical protein
VIIPLTQTQLRITLLKRNTTHTQLRITLLKRKITGIKNNTTAKKDQGRHQEAKKDHRRQQPRDCSSSCGDCAASRWVVYLIDRMSEIQKTKSTEI